MGEASLQECCCAGPYLVCSETNQSLKYNAKIILRQYFLMVEDNVPEFYFGNCKCMVYVVNK